jgi:hypothetical protein
LEIVKGAMSGRTEDAKMENSTSLLGILRY